MPERNPKPALSRAPLALVPLCAAAIAVLGAATAANREHGPAGLGALSLGQKAAQVLLVGVQGEGLPSGESLGLVEGLGLGGVILFGFNLGPEPSGLGAYTSALQDAASRAGTGLPLIVAIDHEGGSVFRFKGSGITRIPPASEVGARGPRYASLLGHAAGAELLALGVNMALAPVVELLTEENESFLGSRSYGRLAGRVDATAGAYIQGLQAEGVAAVAKHFPGNGGEDPHKVLPELRIDEGAYERDYLPRFAAAIANRVSSVMLSHVLFPAIDPDRPASLSPAMVGGELKGRLGFRGLAVTDDLGMRAIASRSSPERSAVAALAAGADLLMITDPRAALPVRDAIVAAVEGGTLSAARLDDAVGRVLALKRRFSMGAALDPAVRAERLSSFASIVAEDARKIRAYSASPP
jgi:beta-N-acetylhexosaminidase